MHRLLCRAMGHAAKSPHYQANFNAIMRVWHVALVSDPLLQTVLESPLLQLGETIATALAATSSIDKEVC